MAFVNLKPGTLLSPTPAVMVSCASSSQRPNIITVAWAGTVNSDPPMLSVSIRPPFPWHYPGIRRVRGEPGEPEAA